MNIRHLTIFRSVCEEMSFTGAAKALYMTQPAISHAIRELEEEVGTVLFERLGKKVCLTQAGELLLGRTVRLLELYATIEGSGKAMEREAKLRIGSGITIANAWLPKLLESLPGVSVRVEVASVGRVMELLQKNQVDLALVEGAVTEKSLEVIPFSSYRVMAVCSPSYPVREEIPLREFAGEKLLLRERGSAVRETLESVLVLSDLTAEPVWVSVNSQALLNAAKHGLGIAVLPETILAGELACGALREVKVEGLSMKNENHLAYHRDKYLTEPMRRLIEVIRAAGGKHFCTCVKPSFPLY